MKKTEIEEILAKVRELKKETELMEKGEQEKYNVGLLMRESIEGLRHCIHAFVQPNMREDTRQNKVNMLKDVGLNLLDVCRIIHLGNGSPVTPPEFIIEEIKRGSKKGEENNA